MINSHLLSRLSNTALRCVTLACRLLLVLMLAGFLPAADVGLFGLFFISVNFGLILAGLNFHAYSNREMVSADRATRSRMVFNQLVLYLIAYAVLLPLAIATFTAGYLPWNLFGLFLAIMVVEHLTYEAYRLFVALGRPLAAGMTGFIRGASWVLLTPPVFYLREDLQSLQTVLVLWLFGGMTTLVYTAILLYRDGYSLRTAQIDTAWLMRGLRVAAPFFIGTVAVRGIFTVDRYLIEALSSLAVVGVYTFYSGLCVALQGIIDAAIFSFTYPKLIQAANTADEAQFDARLRSLALHCSAATAGLALAIYVLATCLIGLLNKPIYLEYLDLLALLLVAYSLFIAGTVVYYGLYAIKADAAILRSKLLALLGFTLSMLVFYVYKPQLFAVPASMIVAFTLLLTSSTLYLRRLRKRFFASRAQPASA